jgi:hypothetical protein
MDLNEIRKNAPEGATHYHKYEVPLFHEVEYARFSKGVRQIWNHHCDEWFDDIVDADEQPDSELKPL